MILEKQIEANILVEGETSQESIGMSLDLDSAQVLMQMLSKNLYSDSIGSTVRECASNALDSHRRAGVTKPIVVSLKINKEDNYEFSVEDFGIGLDDEDVRNIISKYGKSTKRNSTTELGMMGLGFKAPLAYSSSFYFVCRKDGMERKYMMYEGEDTNTIDLLYETSTEEPNGVKVIVPVKYHDRYDFSVKIKEQLAYFENVYFDVKDMNNSFNIIRTEHFQISPLVNNSTMHICLDNVYYPLDFDKLGISTIYSNIGLRFSLTDGVFPTPNRESIRYTKETKDIILAKIKNVATYMMNKYNEKIQTVADLNDILNYYSNGSKSVMIGEKYFCIDWAEGRTDVQPLPPTMSNVNLIPLKRFHEIKEYLLNEYKPMYTCSHGRFSDVSSSRWVWDFKITNVQKGSWYTYNDALKQGKKNYLKSTFNKHTKIMFIKKHQPFTLFNKTGEYNCYYKLLELNKYPKSKWRDLIKEFQYVLSTTTNKFIDADAIDIPQEWKDAQKKPKVTVSVSGTTQRVVKLKGELVGRKAEKLERYVSGKSCKFERAVWKLEHLHRHSRVCVYGNIADQSKLDRLYPLFSKHIDLVVFSERELANLEKIKIHNWIHVDEFMKGKNKVFKRVATAGLIENLINENESIFRRKGVIEKLSVNLSKDLQTLENYKCKWCSNDTYINIIEIAEKGHGFDPAIYSTYVKTKTLLEKHAYLNAFCNLVSRYPSDKDLQMLTDLMKYHKNRPDNKLKN